MSRPPFLWNDLIPMNRMKLQQGILTSLALLVVMACDQGPDVTPPEIRITSPLSGAVVSKLSVIKATVEDDRGLESVTFLIDGDSIGTVYNKPFQLEWNTQNHPNGSHLIQGRAKDTAGNETLSKSIEITVDNALFTAVFSDNWLCGNCGEGVLFVQDMSGNLIGQKSWVGNSTVTIEDLDLPLADTLQLMLTVIRDDSYGNIKLTTYLGVSIGEIWTFRGVPSVDYNSFQTVELDLGTIPSHSGWSFASGWAELYSLSGSIPNPISLNTYQPVTSIYLRLSNTDTGTKYLWEENIQAGGYDLNRNDLLPTTARSIHFPANAQEARALLYGYVNADDYYHGSYLMDFTRFTVNTTDMSVGTAPELMSEYRTQLYYFTNSGWNYNTIYGDVPSDFNVIEADFVVNSADKNDFQITTSGTFDQINSQWRYRTSAYIYTWNVISAPEINQYGLPTLPSMVAEHFPNLFRNQFLLSKTELIDYVGVLSNQEVWEIRFKTPGYFIQHVKETKRRTINN